MDINNPIGNINQIGTRLHSSLQGLTADDHLQYHHLTGLLSARPAFGNAGALYYATDTSTMYYDTGTAWVEWVQREAFTTLSDTPGAYAGNGGKVIKVNAAANGLVYGTATGIVATIDTDQTLAGTNGTDQVVASVANVPAAGVRDTYIIEGRASIGLASSKSISIGFKAGTNLLVSCSFTWSGGGEIFFRCVIHMRNATNAETADLIIYQSGATPITVQMNNLTQAVDLSATWTLNYFVNIPTDPNNQRLRSLVLYQLTP